MATESAPQTTEGAVTRVFFALWPAPALADELGGIAGEMAGSFGGKPTRADTIHLTLAFLGDVSTARLSELVALPPPADVRPFPLSLDRLGIWQHNRLLWMGCGESPPLLKLVGSLRRQLAEAGFLVLDPTRPFFPHLTLVRKLPSGIKPWQQSLPAAIDWPCSEYRLVASTLSLAGSAYTTLARYRLNT